MLSWLPPILVPTPRVTVIIPTYNESSTISRTIRALKQNCDAPIQIIVADGHSADDTTSTASRAGAEVLRVRGGRGIQLNKAVPLARASNLLFLHADTIVPPAFDNEITRVLAERDVVAGAFRLRIDSELLGIRCVQTVANWRSRFLQRPYGDQGLFISKRSFNQVGGYPSMPFLEDYELVRRLSRMGRVKTARTSVITNGRRWETLGVAQTTIMNQLVLISYHLGVSPTRLGLWYRGVLKKAVSLKRRNASPTS